MSAARCSCGRTFGSFVALHQHQEAKGHDVEDASHLALPNRRADDPELEDFHKVAVALCAVAARVKAGEEIDIDAEAVATGVSPRRLVRALRAHGAIIPEFA